MDIKLVQQAYLCTHLILDDLPIVQRGRDVLVFVEEDLLLVVVDVREGEDARGPTVHRHVAAQGPGQVPGVNLQTFPVSIVERLELRGHIDKVVCGVLLHIVDESSVWRQVALGQSVSEDELKKSLTFAK